MTRSQHRKADVTELATKCRVSETAVETFEYAGAGHAFYDRTDASAYRPQAAATARARYLKFLKEALGRSGRSAA